MPMHRPASHHRYITVHRNMGRRDTTGWQVEHEKDAADKTTKCYGQTDSRCSYAHTSIYYP